MAWHIQFKQIKPVPIHSFDGSIYDCDVPTNRWIYRVVLETESVWGLDFVRFQAFLFYISAGFGHILRADFSVNWENCVTYDWCENNVTACPTVFFLSYTRLFVTESGFCRLPHGPGVGGLEDQFSRTAEFFFVLPELWVEGITQQTFCDWPRSCRPC